MKLSYILFIFSLTVAITKFTSTVKETMNHTESCVRRVRRGIGLVMLAVNIAVEVIIGGV